MGLKDRAGKMASAGVGGLSGARLIGWGKVEKEEVWVVPNGERSKH